MTRVLDAIWNWLTEYFMLLLVGLLMLAVLGLMLFAPQTPYYKVPIEFCRAVSTGMTRQQQMPIQNCASYDKNGVCTAPFTTYSTYTEAQVRVTCEYTEWRGL